MSALGIAVLVGVLLLLVSVFMDRILTPWQARRNVAKILRNKSKIDPRALENPKYGHVVGDVECLRLSSAKGDCSELRWSDVEEIHAYKRDLFTTDLILPYV